MKTLIHILLGTLLFAGSCSDEMPVCTPAVHGPRHVTFCPVLKKVYSD